MMSHHSQAGHGSIQTFWRFEGKSAAPTDHVVPELHLCRILGRG
jgi:hypothetical protein